MQSREDTGMHERTITVEAADQAVVRGAIIRRSRLALGVSALFLVLSGVALTLILLGWIPTTGIWLPVGLLASSVMLLLAMWWTARRQAAISLPFGSEHSLAVSADTLDLTGPAGSSHHRWEQFSAVTRERGAVILFARPGRRVFVLMGRLVSDQAIAAMKDRIGQSEASAPTET